MNIPVNSESQPSLTRFERKSFSGKENRLNSQNRNKFSKMMTILDETT